jgi:hypothetical protein
VKRVAGDESTALYEFSVSADDVVLVMGRAAIAFNVFAGVTPAVTSGTAATGVEGGALGAAAGPGVAGVAAAAKASGGVSIADPQAGRSQEAT